MNAELAAAGHAGKAALLYGVRRYRAAEQCVRAALAVDPADAQLHSLLALCLKGRGNHAEALQEAAEAIRLAPDDADPYKIMAVLLLSAEQEAAAETAVRQVLALAPTDADAYALLGSILARRADWLGTLAAADEGLALDPQQVACLNLRALALACLNRPAEAEPMLRHALATAPESADTHAIRGHLRVQAGDFVGAGEHFRDALRLDPDSEPVRIGLIEMLKARNPVYAAILRGQLWLTRISRIARIGVLIVAVPSVRHAILAHSTGSALLAGLDALVMFWVLVGLAPVVFTLTLLSSRFGRRVLRPSETRVAVAVTAGLCAAIGALTGGALTENVALLISVPGFAFGCAALAAAGRMKPGQRRWFAVGGTVVVGVLAVSTVLAGLISPSATGTLDLAGASAVVALGWLIVVAVLARRRTRTTGRFI